MTSLSSLTLFDWCSYEPELINKYNFKYLTNLTSLKICYYQDMINSWKKKNSYIKLNNFSNFRNLTHFNNSLDSNPNSDEFLSRYGRGYSVLDYSKHLKVATLRVMKNISLPSLDIKLILRESRKSTLRYDLYGVI